MSRISIRIRRLAVAGAALFGCGGSDLVLPSDGTPAVLLPVGGNGQSGAAGAPLEDSLVVRVTGERRDPLAGLTVTFQLDSVAPSAEVSPESTTTRADGTARALWRLGATSGTQRVIARLVRGGGAEPLEVTFSATVRAAPAQQIAVADGNGQTAPVASRLPKPLAVLVTDGFGNPVGGITVAWAAQAGSVDPGSSVTDPNGRAETSWTLGSSAGPQSVTASADLTGSPVTFAGTALPGSPNRVVEVSGDEQSAQPGTELQDSLVVQLLDDAGNGVPNRAVSWLVATGGGTVSSATSTTDEEGRASTRWTLGAAGRNTLNAVVSGVGVVAFSATGISGGGGGGGGGGGSTATRLEFRVQPSNTEEGATMSPPVEVAVLDQSGDVVTDRDFEINLELLDRRGKVRADGTVTTRSGVATFTISIDRRGEYRLRATTDGLPSVESDRFEVDED